jgi:hypothetical protein
MRVLRRSALALLAALGCAPRGGAPELLVAEQNARSVLMPSSFAWASSEMSSAELPAALALGGAASGRVLVYLDFPPLNEPRRLLRAELLLETSGTPGDSVPVVLSRAEPLSGSLESWGQQPRALYPRLSARLESERAPARLDVTEIVGARGRSDEPVRILLGAEPRAVAPVLVRTGAGGGLGPRLEAYWE